jgi:hypothetical protein
VTLAAYPQLERCGLGLSGLSEATVAALHTEVKIERKTMSGAASASVAAAADGKELSAVRLLTAKRAQEMQAKTKEMSGGEETSDDDLAQGEMIVVLSDVFLDKPKVCIASRCVDSMCSLQVLSVLWCECRCWRSWRCCSTDTRTLPLCACSF